VTDDRKRSDDDQAGVRPEKAYRDSRFLNSTAARELRILAEFLEPDSRFRREEVHNTVVFFGSARTPSPEEARERLTAMERDLDQRTEVSRDLQTAFEHAQRGYIMSKYYQAARQLAERIAGALRTADLIKQGAYARRISPMFRAL
jgi:2'-5' RNA ligase